jgi:peptidoglycan/xylan/chitin deacetylase (PgdA/CDA1 family)
MSKYSATSIIFLIVLLSMVLLVQYEGIQGWILVFPVAVYLALLILGSVKIGFNFYLRSLCRAKTDEKIVALTFDDGPDASNTAAILELLDKYQVKAAFFCLGKKVVNQPGIVQKLHAHGHLIGNHSYSHHRWFDLFSTEKMRAELNATNEEIEKAIAKKPVFFRPPYGVTNPNLSRAIAKTGMISIGWSLRSFDTIHPAEKVLSKLKKRTSPGMVVLLHDTTEDIVPIIGDYLDWLRQEGFKVVSLEQMFNIKAYA